MFNNTLINLKSTFKKGVDFTKSFSIGTITSIKNDICEELELRKEVKALREAKKASESSEKSE